MQGVSRRVAMLFVMTTDDLDRKDTAFQRDTQLFRLFFRLLTEERSFPNRRTEGTRKSSRSSSYSGTREPDSSLTSRLLPKKCFTKSGSSSSLPDLLVTV